MANPIIDTAEWIHTGNHSFSDITLPSSAVTDSSVLAAANIDADKLQHRHVLIYEQVNGTAVAAQTKMIFQSRFAGTIVAVIVTPYTAPTSSDSYTVDVQKCAQAGSMATVLSSVVTMNSSDANRTSNSGTLSTTTFAASDIFQVVVAVPSANTTGQGLLVTVVLDENCA